MEFIKVFVGSSIDDLKEERRKISAFIQMFNDYLLEIGLNVLIDLELCEFSDMTLKKTRSQDEINHAILTSNLAFFIVKNKFGEYTKEELLYAFEHKDELVETRIEVYAYQNISIDIYSKLKVVLSDEEMSIISFNNVSELIYMMVMSINQYFNFNEIILNNQKLIIDGKQFLI